jgi:superfamily II DNA or RNA helicase
MSCFAAGKPLINLFGKGQYENGLYPNQQGAIGATAAHFSVRNDRALISMPTGTGKTAVMILLSYILEGKKVLVVTPSQLVRKQIAAHFREAKLLIRNNILSPDHLPNVYELKTEENDPATWAKILDQHDVCVAIPSTLGGILTNENIIPNDAFDLVFVDEAHHSRAPSWVKILDYFEDAKQVLLTATPFRRDKKEINAKIIYDYPLKLAYQNKLFSEIRFVPVKREEGMSEEAINIAIAQQTEIAFNKRLHPSHKIIIRTDSKSRAVELDRIYKEHTKLKLSVIYSKLSERTIETRIADLTEGRIDGIICVNMMGEGYDFPALKIAAVHVPHKSLAITLQFVGRIARTNIQQGNIATVIASEQDFAIESTYLYREDSDWSLILPDLHRKKIDGTKDEQEFNESFSAQQVTDEDIIIEPATLSLNMHNFYPFNHVKLYRIFRKMGIGHEGGAAVDDPIINVYKQIDFTKVGILNKPILRFHTISHDHHASVHLIAQRCHPPWIIDNTDVSDIKNELIVCYFNEENSILFICSTVKENELYDHIVENLIEASGLHEMIYIPHLKRVMSGWKNEKFYNLGMKSRKVRGNHESYKQTLGSDVGKGVSPADQFSYTRGHSFGEGFDTVLNKSMMLGISTSSKVWTLADSKVIHLINWCNDLARKIGDPEMDHLNTPLSDLDTGNIIETFPDNPIFFADWDGPLYAKNSSIAFIDDDGSISEEMVLLCSCNILVESVTSEEMILVISKDSRQVKIKFRVSPVTSFEYADDTLHRIVFRKGISYGDPVEFLSEVLAHPIHFFYEDLSQLAGKVFLQSKGGAQLFPSENFIQMDWPATVNVRKEFYSAEEVASYNGKLPMPESIHEYLIDQALPEFDVVFYDHASLEIADVIGLKNGLIRFYHCKKQDSDNPRCHVEDMYEVIGQATKSVNWSNRKLLVHQLIKRADKNGIASKLKKGDLADINRILESFINPSLPVEIVIVQPGLKSSGHSANQIEAFHRINYLLSGAYEYLDSVSACTLRVMCS